MGAQERYNMGSLLAVMQHTPLESLVGDFLEALLHIMGIDPQEQRLGHLATQSRIPTCLRQALVQERRTQIYGEGVRHENSRGYS